MDGWVVSRRVDESHCVGELTRTRLALVVGGFVGLPRFAFEALCCPCVTCLSNVEGGGLLADGQA